MFLEPGRKILRLRKSYDTQSCLISRIYRLLIRKREDPPHNHRDSVKKTEITQKKNATKTILKKNDYTQSQSKKSGPRSVPLYNVHLSIG